MLSGSDTYVEMNKDFVSALNLLENTSENLFVTGVAGTGKSTLLNYFRSITRKNVAVLAPTGVAALNVRGQTIHSFFHFKPDITPETVKKLGAFASRIYKALDTIIIDEASMVRADLLDCIDRFMRNNGSDPLLPFGGAQVVFIGDLYQLPPVVQRDEQGIFSGPYRSEYLFDAHSFAELNIRFVALEKHYRQKDERFISILESIRDNTATDGQLDEINRRVYPEFIPKREELYITLTTTNRHAERINSEYLERLPGKQHIYNASVTGNFDRKILPADELLVIKEGSQIMMLNNDSAKRWVNGSIGKITRIDERIDEGDAIGVELQDGSDAEVVPYTWELFRFSYDNVARRLLSTKVGSFTQYPMMLAWAVTIHKSQGKTFDHVIIDIGDGTFAHGQLYVALSRCTTLEGIVLKRRIAKRHMIMDRRVARFMAETARQGREPEFLLGRFSRAL